MKKIFVLMISVVALFSFSCYVSDSSYEEQAKKVAILDLDIKPEEVHSVRCVDNGVWERLCVVEVRRIQKYRQKSFVSSFILINKYEYKCWAELGCSYSIVCRKR